MTSSSKNRFVKIWSGVAGFLLLAVATVGTPNAQTLKEKIQKGTPVVVATEDDYRPNSCRTESPPAWTTSCSSS
jgi:hypothetical protein